MTSYCSFMAPLFRFWHETGTMVVYLNTILFVEFWTTALWVNSVLVYQQKIHTVLLCFEFLVPHVLMKVTLKGKINQSSKLECNWIGHKWNILVRPTGRYQLKCNFNQTYTLVWKQNKNFDVCLEWLKSLEVNVLISLVVDHPLPMQICPQQLVHWVSGELWDGAFVSFTVAWISCFFLSYTSGHKYCYELNQYLIW